MRLLLVYNLGVKKKMWNVFAINEAQPALTCEATVLAISTSWCFIFEVFWFFWNILRARRGLNDNRRVRLCLRQDEISLWMFRWWSTDHHRTLRFFQNFHVQLFHLEMENCMRSQTNQNLWKPCTSVRNSFFRLMFLLDFVIPLTCGGVSNLLRLIVWNTFSCSAAHVIADENSREKKKKNRKGCA